MMTWDRYDHEGGLERTFLVNLLQKSPERLGHPEPSFLLIQYSYSLHLLSPWP
jgi:hypothetical protein